MILSVVFLLKKVACYICGDQKHLQYQCPHNQCKYEHNSVTNTYDLVTPHHDKQKVVENSDDVRNEQHVTRKQYSNAPRNQNQYAGNQYNAQSDPNEYAYTQYNEQYNNHPRYGQYYERENYPQRSSQNQWNNRAHNPRRGRWNNRSANSSYYNNGRSYGNNNYRVQNFYTSHNRPSSQNEDMHQIVNPTKQNSEKLNTSTNPVVYYGSEPGQMTGLVSECLNQALLDSGAGKTVCGQDWLSVYEDALQKPLENIDDQKIVFRFGDSEPVQSIKHVLLPAELGNKQVFFDTFVVSSSIPLLLSRETMKKAKMTIDFSSDTVKIQNIEHPSFLTSCGQYLIPILPSKEAMNIQSMLSIPIPASTPTKMTPKMRAEKLHKVFAHASAERIYKLHCTAGDPDPELKKALEDTVKNCDVCQRIKRPPPRPKVCLPLSSQFNEVVAMDIKFINQKPVLHVIDTFTRYSTGNFLKSKHASTVIEAIFRMWISVFGRPIKFFSDNGTEFNNNEFIDLCEKYEIKVEVTPVESPYSNGICERHNAIISEMTKKTQSATNCSWEIALQWAINAKNNLQNIYGFSSQQLVFGKNTSLPSITDIKNITSLNEDSVSKIVSDNLEAMRKAREEFMKIENSIRLKRAFKSRVYQYSNELLIPGDEVYFKRLHDKDFHGPGKVVGIVDQSVIIKNGGKLIRLHKSKVKLKYPPHNENLMSKTIDDDLNYQEKFENLNKKHDQAPSYDDNDENSEDESSSESEPEYYSSSEMGPLEGEGLAKPAQIRIVNNPKGDPAIQRLPLSMSSALKPEKLHNDFLSPPHREKEQRQEYPITRSTNPIEVISSDTIEETGVTETPLHQTPFLPSVPLSQFQHELIHPSTPITQQEPFLSSIPVTQLQQKYYLVPETQIQQRPFSPSAAVTTLVHDEARKITKSPVITSPSSQDSDDEIDTSTHFIENSKNDQNQNLTDPTNPTPRILSTKRVKSVPTNSIDLNISQKPQTESRVTLPSFVPQYNSRAQEPFIPSSDKRKNKSLRINPNPQYIFPNDNFAENWTMDSPLDKTKESAAPVVDHISSEALTSTPVIPSIFGSKAYSTTNIEWANQITPLTTKEMTIDDKLKVVFPTLQNGDCVKIKESDREWRNVQLITKGGKASSIVNKYHWNIVNDDGSEQGLFFDRLENFRVNQRSPQQKPTEANEQISILVETSEIAPNTITVEVTKERFKEPHVADAMQKEIQNWIDNDAFVEVTDTGQQFLSSRWVIREILEKDNPTERHCKARLVVRGYEENLKGDKNTFPTSSPTSEKRSLRVLFNVAVSESFVLNTLDIKSAFLKSGRIDRVIFMKPPKFARKTKTLWLLKKPVYGLKDASRFWYKSLIEVLLTLDCKQSKLDKAMFTFYGEENSLSGIIQIHVDDMIYGGTKLFHDVVILKIKDSFEISKEGMGCFDYVGVKINQLGNSISFDQNKFITDIEVPKFEKNNRNNEDLLSAEESTMYRRLVGQLVWVTTQTRPDMMFPVLQCSTKNIKPTVGDMLNLIRVSQKLKNTEIQITIQNIGRIAKDVVMYCFADGRYGTLNEKQSSVAGHIIFLTNGINCSVISWTCTKIKNVVTNVMAAETIALMNGLKEAIYIKELLSEIFTGDTEKLKIMIGAYSDNGSLVKSIHSETQAQDLQMRKHIGWLREAVADSKVVISWIPGNQQIADALTRERSNLQGRLLKTFSGILPSVDASFRAVLETSKVT